MLILKPNNFLKFEGPYDKVSTTYLDLSNRSSDKRIGFKVKTTAPRRYCVRPNSGIIEPGSDTKIAIMLQPIDISKTDEDLKKHKFMVQSVTVDDGDVNLDELWKKVDPKQVTDAKIRCVFELPETTKSGVNEPMTNVTGLGARNKTPSLFSESQSVSPATSQAVGVRQKFNPDATNPMMTEIQRLQKEIERLLKDNENLQSMKRIHDTSYENVSSSQMLSSSIQGLQDGDGKTMCLVAFVVLMVGLLLGKFVI